MSTHKQSLLPITEQRLLRAVRALQQVQRDVPPPSPIGKAIDKALRAILPEQSRLQVEREQGKAGQEDRTPAFPPAARAPRRPRAAAPEALPDAGGELELTPSARPWSPMQIE